MKNSNPTFRFTNETLADFDTHFRYVGTIKEDNIWIYEDPDNKLDNETAVTQYRSFFVQVGNGGVIEIDGFSPNGMTLEQIITKIKAN